MLPTLPWRLALCFIAVNLLVGSESARKISSRYAGPYKIKMTDVYRCNQTEPMAMDFYVHCNERDKSHTECHHLIGNGTVRQEFPKPTPATMIANQWRDREWKRDGIVMKVPDGFETLRSFMPDTYRAIFGNNLRPKKGVYEFNIGTDFTFKAVPVFPYGRWRGDMRMFEQKQGVSPIFCLGFVVDIVPK